MAPNSEVKIETCGNWCFVVVVFCFFVFGQVTELWYNECGPHPLRRHGPIRVHTHEITIVIADQLSGSQLPVDK